MRSRGDGWIIKAFDLGYRVSEDGQVISPYRSEPRKLTTDSDGYLRFTIR